MSKHTLILVLSLLGALALAMPPCGTKPQFLQQLYPAGPPAPSQTVTFQVGLDEVVSGSQVVNLSTATPSKFSSFPSTVTVTNGNSTANFQATLSNSASGVVQVEASCNGGSIDIEVEMEVDGK